MVHQAWFDRIDLTGHGFFKVPEIGYNFDTHEGTPFRYFTQAAAVVSVEVRTCMCWTVPCHQWET